MLCWSPSTRTYACLTAFLLLVSLIEGQAHGAPQEQLIPILGVTTGQNQVGTVSYVRVSFDERQDQAGLMLRFHSTPGRFSRMAQTSIEQAIRRSARSLGISTDSWTVELSVPYEGMTIYGDSVSAMVSLSVAAMAQGKTVPAGHVLTGTVTPEGEIGPAGSIPLKVQAARAAKLRRVVVSKQTPVAEHTGNLPVSIQISPVQSVPEALDALTDTSPTKSVIAEGEPR
jgi:PDZ domain-containing secreted protein